MANKRVGRMLNGLSGDDDSFSFSDVAGKVWNDITGVVGTGVGQRYDYALTKLGERAALPVPTQPTATAEQKRNTMLLAAAGLLGVLLVMRRKR